MIRIAIKMILMNQNYDAEHPKLLTPILRGGATFLALALLALTPAAAQKHSIRR